MGSSYIEGFKDIVSEEQRLEIHLRYNHYPPIHNIFIPVAQKAIKLAQQAIDEENNELCNEIIDLPNGKKLSVYKIIEGLHLDSFLEDNE